MQSLMFLINVNYCMYVIACLVKLLISSLDPLAGRHLGLTIMSIYILNLTLIITLTIILTLILKFAKTYTR